MRRDLARTLTAGNTDFVGQLAETLPDGAENRSDYRPVPASDRGNDGYRDRGGFGSYTPQDTPYAPPSETKWFAGFGADVDDLKRGYCDPRITDDPAFTPENYKYRSTLPKMSDIDEGGDAMEDDYAFRRRNERSRGFLTRPHIPTDR